MNTTDGVVLQASAAGFFRNGQRVSFALRPEHLHLATMPHAGESPHLPARVVTVIFGGSWHRVQLALPPSGKSLWTEGRGLPTMISEGSEVSVTYDPASALIFPSETRK